MAIIDSSSVLFLYYMYPCFVIGLLTSALSVSTWTAATYFCPYTSILSSDKTVSHRRILI